jgi:hypothetical protein
MKVESLEQLKQSLITTYQRYGEGKIIASHGKSWSGVELAQEIENETKFGVELIEMMINLTIDLVKRDKINV